MCLKDLLAVCWGPFEKYRILSRQIEGDIAEQSELVEIALKSVVKFLETVYQFKKPAFYQDLNAIFAPIFESINVARNFSNSIDLSPHKSFLIIVSDTVRFLEWIDKEKPVEFVEEMILNVDKLKIDLGLICSDIFEEWLDSWAGILKSFNEYIREYHGNGLSWFGEENFPLPVLLGDIPFLNRRFDHLALFQDISSKGENILQILKQVNRNSLISLHKDGLYLLKNTGEIFEQTGKRWRIEHKKGDHNSLIIQTATANNTIFVYNCYDCTVLIENTVNVIHIDLCRKVCVIFGGALTELELLDCKDMKIHIFNAVPLIKIAGCKDVSIFLSKKGLNTLIKTNQSSNVHVSYPFVDGNRKIFMIPECLDTYIEPNKGLRTLISTNLNF